MEKETKQPLSTTDEISTSEQNKEKDEKKEKKHTVGKIVAIIIMILLLIGLLFSCIRDGQDVGQDVGQDEVVEQEIDVEEKHIHDYKLTIVEPTHEEEGYTEHKCECGDIYVDDKVPATGHTYQSVITNPTCIKDGYTLQKCSCGDNYKDSIVSKLGHDYKQTVVNPTCTKDGYTTHTCNRCDHTYKDAFTSALGHKFSGYSVTKKPSCTENGTETRKCEVCGATENKTIEKLGHNYVDVIVPPTTETEGYTDHTCENCGDNYKDNFVDKIHVHEFKLVKEEAPTCTKTGLKRYECECGDYYTESSPELGHNYITTTIEPTETSDGYDLHECDRCDDSYKDNYVEKVHVCEYKAISITEPTCTTTGYAIYACSCGNGYEEPKAALGHDYVENVVAPRVIEGVGAAAPGFTNHQCSRCEDNYADNYVHVNYVTFVSAYKNHNLKQLADKYDINISNIAHPNCPNTVLESSVRFTSSKAGTIEVISWDTCEVVEFADETITLKFVSEELTGKDEITGEYPEIIILDNCFYCEEPIHNAIVENGRLVYTVAFDHNHEHDYAETIITKPSCTEDGEGKYECECGDNYTDEIPATGHDYKDTVVEPTIDTEGYTEHVCGNCGDTYKDNYVDKLSNIYILKNGSAFHMTMNSIQNTFGPIESILFGEYEIPTRIRTYDVSLNNQQGVWAWYDNGTVYVSTGNEHKIEANSDCSYMFSQLIDLTTVNMSSVDMLNIENMNNMFMNCYSLKNLDSASWKVDNVTDMTQLFYECYSLTTLDVSTWNTGNVKKMTAMFSRCSNIETLDVSGFDMKNVEDMGQMFYECVKLKNIDVSGFDTSKVTILSYMFYGCEALDRVNVSGWNTSNVQYLNCMFGRCISMTEFNFSNWNTSNVVDMSRMFESCTSLVSIDLTDLEVHNVKNMSKVFYDCTSLHELNVSNWNTENVTNMNQMFIYCTAIETLDLSSFNVSKVEDMNYMFNSCSNLKTIYASDWTDVLINAESVDMFKYCDKLSGAIVYNQENVNNGTMANTKTGYFTAK